MSEFYVDNSPLVFKPQYRYAMIPGYETEVYLLGDNRTLIVDGLDDFAIDRGEALITPINASDDLPTRRIKASKPGQRFRVPLGRYAVRPLEGRQQPIWIRPSTKARAYPANVADTPVSWNARADIYRTRVYSNIVATDYDLYDVSVSRKIDYEVLSEGPGSAGTNNKSILPYYVDTPKPFLQRTSVSSNNFVRAGTLAADSSDVWEIFRVDGFAGMRITGWVAIDHDTATRGVTNLGTFLRAQAYGFGILDQDVYEVDGGIPTPGLTAYYPDVNVWLTHPHKHGVAAPVEHFRTIAHIDMEIEAWPDFTDIVLGGTTTDSMRMSLVTQNPLEYCIEVHPTGKISDLRRTD
jgi:hypothetical protein